MQLIGYDGAPDASGPPGSDAWGWAIEEAQALEEAGLTDIAAHLGTLDPTVGHDSGLYYRQDRIHSNLLREAITGCRVIAEDNPKSDHRPVVATFDLGPAAA